MTVTKYVPSAKNNSSDITVTNRVTIDGGILCKVKETLELVRVCKKPSYLIGVHEGTCVRTIAREWSVVPVDAS